MQKPDALVYVGAWLGCVIAIVGVVRGDAWLAFAMGMGSGILHGVILASVFHNGGTDG